MVSEPNKIVIGKKWFFFIYNLIIVFHNLFFTPIFALNPILSLKKNNPETLTMMVSETSTRSPTLKKLTKMRWDVDCGQVLMV